MIALDPTNAFDARVDNRLRSDEVDWLVTMDPDGTPKSSLVWFLWDGVDSLLIYSQPAPKIRNIAAQPRVAFHLNSDADGTNLITFSGVARLDEAHPKIADFAPYLDKYRPVIDRVGYVVEQFSAEYSQPIIVNLKTLRGF